MEKKINFDYLSLDWTSKLTGAYLEIENLFQRITSDYKKLIPASRSRFFVWDEQKKIVHL